MPIEARSKWLHTEAGYIDANFQRRPRSLLHARGGPYISLRGVRKDELVEREIRDGSVQPLVLLLELLQPPQLLPAEAVWKPLVEVVSCAASLGQGGISGSGHNGEASG